MLALSIALETTNKPAEAIKFREKIVELDPWNTANLLQLLKDHLAVSNKASAQEIAALIKQNYPGSPSDIEASALLVE